MEFAESDDGSLVAFELVGVGAPDSKSQSDPVIVIPGGPCRGPEYLDGLAGCDFLG
ncbi:MULTISPECIES: hypothetical protein [unclassified Leucobacter]|uniref:hypothetical protein n=1 Tax=unclassified Leucobacter TaxID=2621730 RepID=UPI000A9FBA53|nr:hypothetical protein [Leucobacter sp. Ag1]